MPQRFFVAVGDIHDGAVVMHGSVAAHVARSLRMRRGEALVVVDDGGLEHGVVLRSVQPERVEGEISWSRPATGEPRLHLTVVQALPRERMEDCIDLLVEVGAAVVRPVITERVVTRPSQDRLAHRDLGDPPGTLDDVPLLDVNVLAHDGDTHVVLFEVEHQAENATRKFDELKGHGLFQPVDTGDAITDR